MDFFFTDLILLIGTNPLPNYIAAKYFLDNHSDLKNIWLIYSEVAQFQHSTKEFADNIKKVLEKNCVNVKNSIEFKFLPLKGVDNA